MVSAQWIDSPSLPTWIASGKVGGFDVFLGIAEWRKGGTYRQLALFLGETSYQFVLHAEGHPDVKAETTGADFSDNTGTCQGFGIRVLDRSAMIAGVRYVLVAPKTPGSQKWSILGRVEIMGKALK